MRSGRLIPTLRDGASRLLRVRSFAICLILRSGPQGHVSKGGLQGELS